MIEYHPYDLDISGETDLNAKYIRQIEERLAGRSSFSFAVISDTQRWYDETADEVESVNAWQAVDFVIHTGDLSDFGMKMEFEKQRDILENLRVPYVCLLGNHDCLATGEEVYRRVFGDPNFSFVAGNTLFICLNTNALEYDYSQAIPDFAYLGELRENLPPSVTRTIVAMHAGPYTEQFNNNAAKMFHYFIKSFPSLQFCLYGHTHQLGANELFDDGIIYYNCPSANKRTYLRFTLDEEGYRYEPTQY